jgi:hypothetical protein
MGIVFSLFVSPSSCQLCGRGVGVDVEGEAEPVLVGESVEGRGVGLDAG